MTQEAIDTKRALRADLRERRAMLSPSTRGVAAQGIARELLALIDRYGATSVSCYLSSPTEPDTRVFLESALRRGVRVLLPVTRVDGLLDWTVGVEGGAEQIGPLGVPEAAGDLLSPMAVGDVDLMIVPAAAVDTHGMRMGWGRGYFDKTIGSMQKCPPVFAVVYDSEVLDEVPREVHDQPVTGVVTPTRTLLFAS